HPDLAPADSHGQADGAGPYCSSPTARRLYAGASTSSTKGAAYAIAVSCNSAFPVCTLPEVQMEPARNGRQMRLNDLIRPGDAQGLKAHLSAYMGALKVEIR